MAFAVPNFAQNTPADSANHTVSKPTSTATGDLILVVGCSDQDSTQTTMGPPSGQNFALVGQGGAGGGPPGQAGYWRAWAKYAGASEPTSWTFTSSASVNTQFVALRITGASTAAFAVVSSSGTTTKSTNHVAPSVSAPASGDLLLCGMQIIAEATASTYTQPSGMTAHGTTTSVSGTWLRSLVASLVLSAAGATGTKTFTTSITPSNWGDTTWSMILTAEPAPATVAGIGSVPGVNVTPKPKIATFTDDFATADGAKWTGYGGNTVVTGGRLQITPDGGYPSLTSAAVYDLTSSAVYVQVPSMPNLGNGTTEAFFEVRLDGNNYLQWHYTGGMIYADQVVGGSATNVYATAYDASAHAWLRIRESGGSVFWDRSGNGLTWTQVGTNALGFTATAVSVYLAAGYYGTEPAPGALLVDNLNTAPTTPQGATVAGIGAVPAATVTAPTVAVGTVAGVGGVPAAAPAVTAAPATVAAVGAVPTAGVRASAAPSTVAGVGAVPAAVLAARAAPATVAAVGGVPAATVALTASGATVAGVGGVPAATVTTTPSPAPATVAGVGAVPAAGVRVVAAPATVAAVGAVPGAGIASTPAPATVAGVGAVPAAAGIVRAAGATVAGVGAVPAAAPPAQSPAPGTVTGVGAVPAASAQASSDAAASPATVAGVGAVPAAGVRVAAAPATVAGVGGVPAVVHTVARPATVAGVGGVPAASPGAASSRGAVVAGVRGGPTVLGTRRPRIVLGGIRRAKGIVSG